MNEKNERANALLKSFDYFVCDILNARMSKKSCLMRQRDKNCAFANSCNQGVTVYEENYDLREEIFSEQTEEKFNKLNPGKDFKEFNKMNSKGPRKDTKDKMCVFGTCTNDIIARGLCKNHYNIWRTKGLQGIDPYVRKPGAAEVIEAKAAKIKAEREAKPAMQEPKKDDDDTGTAKDPALLYLDLSTYKGLMSNLRKEAHANVRTPEQQAIFYIKHCVGIDQEADTIDVKKSIM